MRIFKPLLYSLVLLYALPGVALAQEGGDTLEITMSVIEDEEDFDEQAVVNDIALPDVAAGEARSNAQQGLETANQARQQGSENRNERAEEGRDRRPDGGNGGGGQGPGSPPIQIP